MNRNDNDRAAPSHGRNGGTSSVAESRVSVSRKNSLLRDMLFPLYSIEQFLWVLFFCVVTYLVSLLIGDWRIVIAGYAGGSIALTTMAPARLKFSASALPLFYDLLEKMHFTRDPNSTRYRYRRWLAFRNSYLDVRCGDETIEVDGPMSTLKVIASVLERRMRN